MEEGILIDLVDCPVEALRVLWNEISLSGDLNAVSGAIDPNASSTEVRPSARFARPTASREGILRLS